MLLVVYTVEGKSKRNPGAREPQLLLAVYTQIYYRGFDWRSIQSTDESMRAGIERVFNADANE